MNLIPYALAQPVPSGVTPPTEWEIRIESLKQAIWGLFNTEGSIFFDLRILFTNFANWITQNALWVGILLLVIAGIWFAISQWKEKRKRILRVWVFLLYFLGKRHTILPALIDLSEKVIKTDPNIRQEIITLRQECRELSLRKNPTERMNREKKISKIIFQIFTTLESQKKLKTNPKLKYLEDDLEFLDEKLITLQEKYNTLATQFNERLFLGETIQNMLGITRLPLFVV